MTAQIDRLRPRSVEFPENIDQPFEIFGSNLDESGLEIYAAADGKGCVEIPTITIVPEPGSEITPNRLPAIAHAKNVDAQYVNIDLWVCIKKGDNVRDCEQTLKVLRPEPENREPDHKKPKRPKRKKPTPKA